MGKKELLATAMWRLGLLKVLRKLRKQKRGELIILAYHRILDVDDYNTYPFDPELISASCDEFAWQMNHLKRHYHPMTLLDVLDYQERGEELPKNAVVVTFDDGFDDNYYNAFKILKALDMSATFFISTDYIDETKVFWFDWLVFAMKKTEAERVCFVDYGFDETITHDKSDRSDVTNRVMKFLREIPDEDRVICFESLQQQLNVAMTDEEKRLSGSVTTDEIIEMAESGMEIGSHTMSHPMLSRLSEENLAKEMSGSRAALNSIKSVNCRTIAFPFGGASAFNDSVKREAKAAGYGVACSYQSGLSNIVEDDNYQLKRLHVDYQLSRPSFVAMLAEPKLFGLHWLDGSVYSTQ